MTTFPVSASTLSPLHLVAFLQESYDLSKAATCSLFRTGMNHLYVVTDGDRKFVFRVYTRDWRSKTEILEELRLLFHLKKKTIAVAYPIEDRKGHLVQELQAPEGLRYAVLFSFATGEKIPHFTAKASYHIGQTLGSIHRVTKDFTLERVTYNTETLFVHSLEQIKSVFKIPSPALLFIEKLRDHLVDSYANTATENIATGAIHFDVWFDNMHLSSKGKATIFDFDFCGNGWLCYDVSYFLYQLFNTHQDEMEYEEKAAQFLKGYTETNELSEEEQTLLPKACLAMMLFYIGVQCYRFDWSNIFLSEHHLNRMTGMMKKWMAYHKIVLPN